MSSQNPSSLHERRPRDSEHDHEALKQKASEALKGTIDEIRERSDDVKETIQEYVQQKPLKALGIAVLSGMALALLMRR
jgi:ElaB/YqjD/DUF883 family membrane-anchored ribosome-binding protein